MQYINNTKLPNAFGQALGTGIGGALQALAQHKIQSMLESKQQNKIYSALESLGYSPQESSSYSKLDPEILKEIIKSKLQHPSQETYAQTLQALLGGEQQSPQFSDVAIPSQELVESTQKYQPTAPTQTQEDYIKSLSSLFGGSTKPSLSNLFPYATAATNQPTVVENPQEAITKTEVAPVVKALKEPKVESKKEAIKIPANLSQQQSTKLAELLLKKQESARKQEGEEKKLSAIEQQKINKAEKPYVDKINAYKESADDSEKRLNKMQALIKKGNLPVASFYNAFKNLEEHANPSVAAPAGAAAGFYVAGPAGAAIGGTLGGLIGPVSTLLRGAQKFTSPDTEEFEKLSNDFVKNAKSIFGSRITDADLKAFLSTVPTLSQTDSGKLAIINNMKSFNKAAQVRYKTMREIIKDNGNRIPDNLEFLVNDKSQPELDKIAQEFATV